ncbi:MAG: hypothetical protein WA061_01915 [Microgenomates group bacterium]
MNISEETLRELCDIPKENRIGFVSAPHYHGKQYYGECIFIWKENAELKAGVFEDILGCGRIGDKNLIPRHFEFKGWFHAALAIDNPTRKELEEFVQMNFGLCY